jgi:NHL repeat
MSWMKPVRLVGLGLIVLSLGCGDDGGTGPGNGSSLALTFETFQKASTVIGQPDMTSQTQDAGSGDINAVGLEFPGGAGAGSFYLADPGNHRVLGYTGIPASNGAAADFVIGPPDLTTRINGTSAGKLDLPSDCVVSGGKLFVSEVGNSRVLIWNFLPRSSLPASVVVGQPDFTSSGTATTQTGMDSPSSLAVAGGKLIVADNENRRALIWNSIPTTNGAPADVVVGQPDFTTSIGGLSASRTSWVASVWSDGKRLVLGDNGNRRVLIWNSVPTTNGAPADVVVGAPDFVTPGGSASASTFSGVDGVASDGTSLFVADSGANRVLIFTPFPTTNGAAASRVLGQSDFTHTSSNDDNQDSASDATPSARVMRNPTGVRVIGRRLLVADTDNHRVLVFRSK